MWHNVDSTLSTLLAKVGPGIGTHPLSVALWAFVFAKTPFLAVVWGRHFGTNNKTHSNCTQQRDDRLF